MTNSNHEFELDLDAVRMDVTPEAGLAVKKVLTEIPVSKWSSQEFFRTHPDYWYGTVGLIKFDDEFYLVMPALLQQLPGEFKPFVLYLTQNRAGDVRFVPVQKEGPDGKHNSYHRSLQEHVLVGMKKWVRVVANQSKKAYERLEVPDEVAANIPEPPWPAESLKELLAIAFRGRVIDSLDHPIAKKLRGLV
jgi:hypothetical protein